jgi:hypothetical protein
MEPVGPLRAARQVEQARTADIADHELRRRGGFLATARRRREEEMLAQREVELADGHGQFRFSAYVTVSAGDAEQLVEACGRVEQAAAQAGLDVRVCPFELYRAGVLTNPNMVVFGQIGRGKSAFVKTYLWRQAVFGRRAWIVDPKGEYGSTDPIYPQSAL